MKSSRIIVSLVIILLCFSSIYVGVKKHRKIESTKKILLSEDDFDISYKSLIINDKIDVSEITDKIGFGIGHESNNYGLISQIDGIERWQLYYPGKNNAKLRLIYLNTGEINYLVSAYLIDIPTKRGLKVGDSY